MATTDAAEARKREVSDVSYTAPPDVSREGASSVSRVEYAPCDVIEGETKAKIRTTLSPEDFGVVHDEDLTYQELFISDVNAGRFQPPLPTGDPAPNLYVQKDDDMQFAPQEWIATNCTCADGSKSKGRKNVRTGYIDCECNKNPRKKPSVYRPKAVKPRKIDTKPLKDQAGVSYMGNVKLEPCKAFDNEAMERADGTLNDVIQLGKENSKNTARGKTTTKKSESYSIYAKCDHNYHQL